MKDPDVQGADSEADGDSSEVEDGADFAQFAMSRIKFLFRGRKNADPKDKSVQQLLKKNDLKLIQKLIDRVVDHSKKLDHLKIKEKEFDGKMEYLHSQDEVATGLFERISTDIEELNQQQAETKDGLTTFSNTFFPQYMADFSKNVANDVLKKTVEVQADFVTVDMLADEFTKERESKVQENINKLDEQLRETFNQKIAV